MSDEFTSFENFDTEFDDRSMSFNGYQSQVQPQRQQNRTTDSYAYLAMLKAHIRSTLSGQNETTDSELQESEDEDFYYKSVRSSPPTTQTTKALKGEMESSKQISSKGNTKKVSTKTRSHKNYEDDYESGYTSYEAQDNDEEPQEQPHTSPKMASETRSKQSHTPIRQLDRRSQLPPETPRSTSTAQSLETPRQSKQHNISCTLSQQFLSRMEESERAKQQQIEQITRELKQKDLEQQAENETFHPVINTDWSKDKMQKKFEPKRRTRNQQKDSQSSPSETTPPRPSPQPAERLLRWGAKRERKNNELKALLDEKAALATPFAPVVNPVPAQFLSPQSGGGGEGEQGASQEIEKRQEERGAWEDRDRDGDEDKHKHLPDEATPLEKYLQMDAFERLSKFTSPGLPLPRFRPTSSGTPRQTESYPDPQPEVIPPAQETTFTQLAQSSAASIPASLDLSQSFSQAMPSVPLRSPAFVFVQTPYRQQSTNSYSPFPSAPPSAAPSLAGTGPQPLSQTTTSLYPAAASPYPSSLPYPSNTTPPAPFPPTPQSQPALRQLSVTHSLASPAAYPSYSPAYPGNPATAPGQPAAPPQSTTHPASSQPARPFPRRHETSVIARVPRPPSDPASSQTPPSKPRHAFKSPTEYTDGFKAFLQRQEETMQMLYQRRLADQPAPWPALRTPTRPPARRPQPQTLARAQAWAEVEEGGKREEGEGGRGGGGEEEEEAEEEEEEEEEDEEMNYYRSRRSTTRKKGDKAEAEDEEEEVDERTREDESRRGRQRGGGGGGGGGGGAEGSSSSRRGRSRDSREQDQSLQRKPPPPIERRGWEALSRGDLERIHAVRAAAVRRQRAADSAQLPFRPAITARGAAAESVLKQLYTEEEEDVRGGEVVVEEKGERGEGEGGGKEGGGEGEGGEGGEGGELGYSTGMRVRAERRRYVRWMQEQEEKRSRLAEQLRKQKEEEEMRECTFHPRLNKGKRQTQEIAELIRQARQT